MDTDSNTTQVEDRPMTRGERALADDLRSSLERAGRALAAEMHEMDRLLSGAMDRVGVIS